MLDLQNHAVLFDLDGTFIDTAKDLTEALNHAVAQIGLPPYDVSEAKYFVGKGVAHMLERALTRAGRTLDKDLQGQLTETLLEHYIANISRHSRPFPHAMDCLKELKSRGAKVGICTNKAYERAIQLLDELGITGEFDCVTGGDSFPFKKPDPRHLVESFALMEAGEKRFMIGDTINDFAAAKEAGVISVGVRFGYGLQTDLQEADHLIDDFESLVPLIKTLESR